VKAIFIDGPMAGKCQEYRGTPEQIMAWDRTEEGPKQVIYERLAKTNMPDTWLFQVKEQGRE
jgi:hypothetical protein